MACLPRAPKEKRKIAKTCQKETVTFGALQIIINLTRQIRVRFFNDAICTIEVMRTAGMSRIPGRQFEVLREARAAVQQGGTRSARDRGGAGIRQ
jgi:hypothetical protein